MKPGKLNLDDLEFLREMPQEMYRFTDDLIYSDEARPEDTDDQVRDAVFNFFKENDFGVKHEIVNLCGDHGWPVIQVTGTLPSILHFLSVFSHNRDYLTVPIDVARSIVSDHQ